MFRSFNLRKELRYRRDRERRCIPTEGFVKITKDCRENHLYVYIPIDFGSGLQRELKRRCAPLPFHGRCPWPLVHRCDGQYDEHQESHRCRCNRQEADNAAVLSRCESSADKPWCKQSQGRATSLHRHKSSNADADAITILCIALRTAYSADICSDHAQPDASFFYNTVICSLSPSSQATDEGPEKEGTHSRVS